MRVARHPSSVEPSALPSLAQIAAGTEGEGTRAADLLPQVVGAFEAHEPRIHAFVEEGDRFGRLRREAATTRSTDRGSWVGAFVGVKDIFHVRGLPTTAGSRLPPEALAGPQGDAVDRLRGQGALVLGKTVSTEFAYFAPGPTRNPRNPDHTPGGSSSGSAAAVAARLVPLALGTQTIGSVIRPAAFCGVVGFKPTQGRIPATGVIPLAPSLDHVGFFTTDAVDCAIASATLIGDWAGRVPGRSPRLGIPLGPYLEQPEASAQLQFRSVVQWLIEHGYSVAETPFPGDYEAVVQRHQLILAGEAAQVHRDWFAKYSSLYHPRTAALLEEGRRVPIAALDRARKDRDVWAMEVHDAMAAGDIDLWVTPAALGVAPRGLSSTGDPAMNLPWTQARLPALTVPSGEDSSGLPYGLQIIGRPGEDERLVHWAIEIERCLEGRAP